MIGQTRRSFFFAGIGLLTAWLLALGGYTIAKSSRMTLGKLKRFLRSSDLDRLSGQARAKALRELAAQLNALSREERQHARLDAELRLWFEKMTEDEKAQFLETTLPTGFKQMLSAFEELPVERRKKAIDDALKRIRETRQNISAEDGPISSAVDTNTSPGWSDELEKKATTIGLRTFYSQSSAKTKAEMAPVLEELQQMMESGTLLRRRR